MDVALKKVDDQLSKLRQALEQQKNELRESMDSTLKAVNQRQKPELKPPVLPVVDNLLLPPDLRKWRTAHVLAWLVFDRGLKQYVLAFHEASIDGIVLVTHVTEGGRTSFEHTLSHNSHEPTLPLIYLSHTLSHCACDPCH